MHSWGDDWNGWEDLYKAEKVMYFWGVKIGRIGGQIKEKWGGIRWYAQISEPDQLHDILKAGHAGFRWSPNRHPFMCWLNNLSKSYMFLIGKLVFKYREFMYGFAYYMACRKFPHIKKEILDCVDYPELLFKSEAKFLKERLKDGTS